MAGYLISHEIRKLLILYSPRKYAAGKKQQEVLFFARSIKQANTVCINWAEN